MSFKSFLSNIKDYLLSIYFWRTVAGLVIFVLAVVLLSSLYLKVYTRHGQRILTPALQGMKLDEAYKLARKKGLHIQVIDSIYEGIGDPGTIVDQTPPPNFNIKKGRTIFVTIKAFSPKMVTVPNLTEISLTQANFELQRIGLDLGHIIYQPSANFDNLVLAMLYNGDTLRPGTELPAGTKIDLVVAKRMADSLYQAEPQDTTVQNDENMFEEF